MKQIYQAILIITIFQIVIINTLAIPLKPETFTRLNTRDPYEETGTNSAEDDYCFSILNPSHALNCIKAKDLADEALRSAQANYPPETLHNGAGDAYRHYFWSGLLTFEFGVTEAKGFGDRHEKAVNDGRLKTL
jgi:hypothetical protein